MGCLEIHWWSTALLQCLLPPTSAQAPPVPGLEAREIVLRARSCKVVARAGAESEEGIIHDDADRVDAPVTVVRIAASVPEPPSFGILAACLEGRSKHIDGGFHGGPMRVCEFQLL